MNPSSPRPDNQPTTLMELRNVGKTFPSAGGNPPLEVLKNINLKVSRGDYTVITGKSGSGKSTLLGIITGLHKPSSGEIWLAGKPNNGYKDRAASQFRQLHVGFVFQNF